ncbi:uncharacterized protein DUF3515 [Stackebrandtia albiflava]|uniref:Uncharacterized protein DUF3515 n=1 Tax=Stackebrandtia albiflava TaxID=406432 RepID=A0A562VAB1_9ACTN|nr:DUF3515 family protein [Stackebrandtia albiflava]TWJ14804.1 uncharacterized protein DUF3515 [Stackebrandtia albiflava]
MAENRDDESTARPSGTDPERRRAARIATLVAVPVTVLAGIGAFSLIGSAAEDGAVPDAGPVMTEPVELTVPDMTEDEFEVCRALVTEVPAEVLEQPQRPVTGGDGAAEVGAAWGDPAVTMVCGVEPVEVAVDAQVYRLGETCWSVAESKDASVWTTVDRRQPVEVTVPAGLDSPGQAVQALSKAVAAKVPAAEEGVPTGCSG